MLSEWLFYTASGLIVVFGLLAFTMRHIVWDWIGTWNYNRRWDYWLTEGQKYSADNEHMREIIWGLIGNKEAETYGYPWIDDFGPCVYCHAYSTGSPPYEDPETVQHNVDCPFEKAMQFMEGK